MFRRQEPQVETGPRNREFGGALGNQALFFKQALKDQGRIDRIPF
jgi:hypothetical protein